MSVYTVITSINSPTEAVKKHTAKEGRKVIVVGDKKSPADWSCDDAFFLPFQDHFCFNIDQRLSYNHYARKMIGYLHAYQAGAEVIIDTDDDNIPYSSEHEFPEKEGVFTSTPEDLGFYNVYSYYTQQKIWPRGLPLDKISASTPSPDDFKQCLKKVGIWQGLADMDPDVDAIYRLTDYTPCTFLKKGALVLSKGTIAPFNSQNTLFFKDFFPLLYLPAYVSFRFTDIVRGYVAQPVLWAMGHHLGFIDASVFQERNEHSLMSDFEQEIPMYLHSSTVANIACDVAKQTHSVNDNIFTIYAALVNEDIVPEKELALLELWLKNF